MERVLIVEDEPGIASFVKLELTHEGYQAQVAEDGRSALDFIQQEEWDLISTPRSSLTPRLTE